MSNIITIKHGANKPSINNLSNFELGFCTGDGHLYINNNGTIVSTKSGTATVFPGEEIPSNADLNTYTIPGSYRSSSGSISETLANTPFTVTGFKLEVFNTTTANQIMQEIKCNSASSRVYRRTGNFKDDVWSFTTWYKVMQSATDTLSVVDGGTNGANAFEATNNLLALYLGNLTDTANDLAENSNLDDITAGVYRSGTKDVSATITNAPTTATGFRLIASYLTSLSSFIQIAIGYSTNVNIWVRIKTNAWGDWKKLTFA